MNAVDIELGLAGEHIGASALRDSLTDLLDLLEKAADVAQLETQDWRIECLRSASAHVALAAPEGGLVARVVVDGIEALRGAAAIPDRWTMKMVRRVQQLASRSGTAGTLAVTLTLPNVASAVALDSVVAAHAEEAIGAEVVNLGSLRGRADRWNEHSTRHEIGISDDEGRSVTIKYGNELRDRIISEALGQHVEVWGKVKRNLAGQLVGMRAEGFRVLAQREPVSIGSLRGSYGNERGVDPGTLERWLGDRHGE